jgi:hypothetical protein
LRVTKGACAKARLWSHGDVRLAPGVKLRRVGFHEGPVDSFKGFQQEPEEPFRLRRRSIQRPGGHRTLLRSQNPAEVGGLHHLIYAFKVKFKIEYNRVLVYVFFNEAPVDG